MIDRRRWLEGANDETLRTQLARLYDLLCRCVRLDRPVYSDFIGPVVQDLCELRMSSDQAPAKFTFVGGHEPFESCVVVFYPFDGEPDVNEAPVVLLEIMSTEKDAAWSHRDLLGSLLGLGLSREKFGDMRVGDNASYVFVLEALSDFVSTSLTRISRYPVSVRMVDWEAFPMEDAGGELLFRTVPSLRLDAVIAAGFDLSRSTAQKLVESERVKINHRPYTRPDKAVPEGAVISVRGYGRLVLEKNLGTSKKDREKMQLKRFR
jgi:RNA-binding protein YlmH